MLLESEGIGQVLPVNKPQLLVQIDLEAHLKEKNGRRVCKKLRKN
jgi:hypothetical protein